MIFLVYNESCLQTNIFQQRSTNYDEFSVSIKIRRWISYVSRLFTFSISVYLIILYYYYLYWLYPPMISFRDYWKTSHIKGWKICLLFENHSFLNVLGRRLYENFQQCHHKDLFNYFMICSKDQGLYCALNSKKHPLKSMQISCAKYFKQQANEKTFSSGHDPLDLWYRNIFIYTV